MVREECRSPGVCRMERNDGPRIEWDRSSSITEAALQRQHYRGSIIETVRDIMRQPDNEIPAEDVQPKLNGEQVNVQTVAVTTDWYGPRFPDRLGSPRSSA